MIVIRFLYSCFADIKNEHRMRIAVCDDNRQDACDKAYYTCNGCDKWFSDAEGTQEITDKDSVVISKTGHSYGTAWSYRTAEGHAHYFTLLPESRSPSRRG